MPGKNISPEKRLLSMIEGQQQETRRPSPAQLGNKYFSLNSVRGRLVFLLDRAKKRERSGRSADAAADLRRVNRGLQIAIAIVAGWLVISSTVDYRRVQQRPVVEIQSVPPTAQAAALDSGSLMRPLSVYLVRAAARDIFSLPSVGQEKPAAAFREQPENEQIKQLTDHLKLVGISWSESPDAIIEDTRAQRSYFVKEGALIDGVGVFKILKDRVILRYLGEEVDLR